MSIGRYAGHEYKRQRICDVMHLSQRSYAWFLYDANGKPTGDHFATLKQLKKWVDGHEHTKAVALLR